MSQFDVQEEGSLLGFRQQWPQFDEVLGHFPVKLGLEPGHLLKGKGHRRFIKQARGGEEFREFLPLGIDRRLTGEEIRVMHHRDLMNLLLLRGGQVQDIEGIVGCGLNRTAIRMHGVGHGKRDKNGEKDSGERGPESHHRNNSRVIAALQAALLKAVSLKAAP